MKEIKLGIIGLGARGRHVAMYIRNAAKSLALASVRVTAVCDLKPKEECIKYAASDGYDLDISAAEFFATADELLEKADIDACIHRRPSPLKGRGRRARPRRRRLLPASLHSARQGRKENNRARRHRRRRLRERLDPRRLRRRLLPRLVSRRRHYGRPLPSEIYPRLRLYKLPRRQKARRDLRREIQNGHERRPPRGTAVRRLPR